MERHTWEYGWRRPKYVTAGTQEFILYQFVYLSGAIRELDAEIRPKIELYLINLVQYTSSP